MNSVRIAQHLYENLCAPLMIYAFEGMDTALHQVVRKIKRHGFQEVASADRGFGQHGQEVVVLYNVKQDVGLVDFQADIQA